MNAKLIDNAGGCIVSNNILNKKGILKWCIKEESANKVDNGWRFLSDIDTEEFLNDSNNMSVCDYNTVAEIEPAVLIIYNMPIGTDITLVQESSKKYFVDNKTGDMIIS